MKSAHLKYPDTGSPATGSTPFRPEGKLAALRVAGLAGAGRGARAAPAAGGAAAPCAGTSEAIAVSAAPQTPQALFEIELTLQNRTDGALHVDPG